MKIRMQEIFTEEETKKLEKALDAYSQASAHVIEEHFNISHCDALDFSDEYKKKINRLCREKVGIPIFYPEVDNGYERFRSRMVRVWLVFVNGIRKWFGRPSKIL